MAFSKVTVAVAATALALLAPAAYAEPQDVLRTADAGVVEALEHEVAASRDVGSEADLGRTYSNTIEIDGYLFMTVAADYPGDARNSQSYYVCATEDTNDYMRIKFSGNPNYGDVLMQVAEVHSSSANSKQVVGWYLSVLDEVPADTKYSGYTRLSVQPDKSKATKWYLPTTDVRTSWIKSKYMRVRDAPGLSKVKDMFLAIPPNSERDSSTQYLAVGPMDGWDVYVELK